MIFISLCCHNDVDDIVYVGKITLCTVFGIAFYLVVYFHSFKMATNIEVERFVTYTEFFFYT